MSGKAIDDVPDDRDEAAAFWCMKLAEAPLSGEEQRAFEQWLAVPGHRRHFDEAVAVWEGLENIAESPEVVRVRAQALESFTLANRQRWSKPKSYRIPYLAAAVAMLLVVLGGLAFLRDGSRTYETGTGERQIAVLDDGSRLSLDAASTVDVRMRGNSRALTLLRGRAKFDVAKDPLRPFSVTAGDKIVVATGTSFSVERLGNDVRVLLYEGHVEVLRRGADGTRPRSVALRGSAAPASAALLPGRELIIAGDTAPARIEQPDVPRSLLWETGQLSFDEEPLPFAIERMNRYSNQKLVIADHRVAALRVNGVFTAGDVAAFTEGLTALYPVTAATDPRQITLRSR